VNQVNHLLSEGSGYMGGAFSAWPRLLHFKIGAVKNAGHLHAADV
jgi:hypothetical protein